MDNNEDSNENEDDREDKRKDHTYDKTPDPKREKYQVENKNKTILLLEKTIVDYEEKCEIEMATVDAIQLLVESLNEEHVSN